MLLPVEAGPYDGEPAGVHHHHHEGGTAAVSYTAAQTSPHLQTNILYSIYNVNVSKKKYILNVLLKDLANYFF